MYQRGKIYKIEPVYDGDEGDVYIGSTCEKYLSNRLSSHRSKYKTWKNGKQNRNVSVFKLFDKYGVEDCEITLLEKYPCESKEELRAREGYHIKSMNCVNKRVAGRTIEQYRKDNKNKIKQYYEDNKENTCKRQKQYYKDNKDKINAQQSQKHVCICGGKFVNSSKSRHMKSKKHLEYIADHEDDSDSDSDNE